jgi:serine/threonine protein kinase/tetratricopeptide (TPR) repeat protein
LPYGRLEEIGRGGFGTVYRGTFQGRSVALKIANGEAYGIRQLVRENDVLIRLRGRKCPRWIAANLPDPALPIEEQSGPFFIVMEFVAAKTLAQLLEETMGPLELELAQEIALGMVNAVGELHRIGYVHRDLKPENFFVSSHGVKIFDFGLAQKIGPDHQLAQDERWAGTPEYMAPEQCEGDVESSSAGDIYSLGVILYEIFTGNPPFWGTEAEIKEGHRSRRPPMLNRVPPLKSEITRTILSCLAKSAAKRLPSTEQLHAALVLAFGASTDQDAANSNPAAPLGNHPEHTTSTSQPAVEITTKPVEAAPRANRDRQTVGLVWFESDGAIAQINSLLAEVGGQLASTAQTRHVAAFSHASGDNPVRTALQAARTLIARALTTQAIVDIATVSLRTRPDGSSQYMSPVFSKRDRFPSSEDPTGICVTNAAAELIPETPIGPAARPGLAEILGFGEAAQVTIVRRTDSPFFGHTSIIDTLTRSAVQAALGRPTLITVVGGPGYGKSAFASHIAHAIADLAPQMDVEALRALEPLGMGTHRTLDELTKRVLSLPERCPPEQAFGLCRERLGDDFAQEVRLGLSIALGWLAPDDPELRSLSAAPGALRSAAAFAVGKILRRLSSIRAIALIIDDAHYVDETLLDALEYAGLAENSARFWVCLIARPSFREQRPNFGERAERKLHVELPALSGLDARALARHLLQPVHGVPDRALDLLVERTQGVPLLLADLIRGLRRDNIIRPSERGSGWILATDELERLPALPAVQWLAANEVAALPASLAALARLAAVQGPQFTEDELDTLVHELEMLGVRTDSDLDVSVGLRRLADAGLITSDRRPSFRFRHDLLRGILYQSVDENLRRAIHQAAHELTFRRNDLAREERLQRLLFHAARAGLRAQAADAAMELASVLQSRHTYLEGESTYAQALAHLEEADPRRLDAIWRLGNMQFRVGRNDEALKQYERALDLARARQDREREVDLMLDIATTFDWLDDYNRSATFVEEAQTLAEGMDNPLLKARIDLGRGRAKLRHNFAEEAKKLTLRAAERAQALGDDAYETHVIALLMAGAALGVLGDAEASRSICDQAMELAQAHGDNIHLGGALQNRIFVWIMQNNVEALLDDMRKVIEIARESGATVLEGRSLYNLGEVIYLVGDYRAAERHAKRSIEVHQSLVGPGNRTLISYLLLARTHLANYDAKSAKQAAQELRATQLKAREQGRADAELVASDELLLACVELALRGGSQEEWSELLKRSQTQSVQQEQIEVIELAGVASLLAGDSASASAYFDRALALAQTIPNIMGNRLSNRMKDLKQRDAG